ncbi:methyl-accepting chemotaxis protein [Paenibacillus harenae]|uniref:methyl-accepting chemotaxis protein n=1 Tax=Paenibacillus harenae TaxID=306543 RepID=UPI00278EA059|nr:methyl-accepting chemotaxis protein [Paenibacillus harenae]MDQ0059434.1 methyl-accepting chemotaxis protein [Paenibacillus harenae]
MKLSIRVRLALLAAVPLALYVFTSIYLLDQQKNNFEEMKHSIYETASKANTLVLNADRDMYQSYTAYLRVESGTLDAAGKSAAGEEVASNLKQAGDRMAEAIQLLEETGIGHYTYGESGRSVDEISKSFTESFGSWSKLITAANADNVNQSHNDEVDKGFIDNRNGIDEIGQNIDKYAEIHMTEMDESLDQSLLTTFIGIIVVTIITILMVVITVRMIMKTVYNVVSKTKRVTEFDLTVESDAKYSKDELGQINQSVDQMIGMMQRLIKGIVAHAKEVSDSSAHLTSASKESEEAANHVALHIQEVATGSEVQARGSAETSKAIEEMTIGIQRIAENTATLAEHSTSTSHQVDDGKVALERLIEQMQSIKSAIEDLSGTIVSLENRSKQIGAIAENITTFSNQTNILSLNASIEAARAGEHGKGFAVVASEIRKLAASSLESADGIHQLVSVTRAEIDGASSYMAETKESFEKGAERVSDIRQNLEVIVASISQMTEQLHENSAITEQMSASSQQVNASMEQASATASMNMSKTEQVAAATEEQLALVENIASTAEQLSGLVDILNNGVSKFKL